MKIKIDPDLPLITPIVIDIDDPKRYGDVAFLVDRVDFLKDLFHLRKKWDISEDSLFKYPLEKSWSEFPWKEDKELSEEFKTDIANLRRKYKRPPNFENIIAISLLCGAVMDEDYITVLSDIIYPGEDHRDPELAIIYYPLAKPEEILEVFRKEAPVDIKVYEKEFIGASVYDPDTIANVKRDRDWYIFHKYGSSYNQIYEQATNQGITITKDGMRMAIKQYEKRLKTKI